MQRGEISAEEAADWQEEVPLFTPFFINTVYFYAETVAAKAIGIDEETLWEQLDSGSQSVADIAEANGVAAQTVIDAVIASEANLIDEMVAAGLIDAEDAREWKADVAEEMTQFITQPFEAELDEGEDSAEE